MQSECTISIRTSKIILLYSMMCRPSVRQYEYNEINNKCETKQSILAINNILS